MLDDVHVPVMQTSGTTNTKANTANDELILLDSLSGDGTDVLFRLTFMIFCLGGLVVVRVYVSCFFWSSLTTERTSRSRVVPYFRR